MVKPYDKFASVHIPNCERTASQEDELQYEPFTRVSDVFSDDSQSPSSMDSSLEQATGIEMVSLPDSFDDYQTPPEQPYSQNSSSDGHVAAATKTLMTVDDGNEPRGQRVVDLAKDSDNLDTEQIDVDERVDEVDAANSVTEALETELISSPDKVQEISSREKCELPEKQNINILKNEDFKNTLVRLLKMVAERKKRDAGNEDDDADVDFLETVKKKGMTFPRPRWWPEDGGSRFRE